MLTKGQRGSRRLVDDIYYIEASHLPGIGRRLPSWFVEIGRHRDDDAILFSNRRVDVAFYLLENVSLNDLGRKLLAMNRARASLAPHLALNTFNNGFWLRSNCGTRLLAYQDLIAFEQHDAWRENLAVGVANHR